MGESWLEWNTVYPELNNVDICEGTECEETQATRPENFLRVQQSHYLISPHDKVESQWHGCLLGLCFLFMSESQILMDIESLGIIYMEGTIEFQNDPYSFKTASD